MPALFTRMSSLPHVGDDLAGKPVGLDLPCQLLKALGAAGDGNDRGALLGKVVGNLATHARARTGDDDALSLKTHDGPLSLAGNTMPSV